MPFIPHCTIQLCLPVFIVLLAFLSVVARKCPFKCIHVHLSASTCISWAQTGQTDRPKAQLGLRLTFRTAVASAPGSDARCSGPFEGHSFPFAPSEDGVCQEPASLPPSLPSPGPGAALAQRRSQGSSQQRDRRPSKSKRELHFLGNETFWRICIFAEGSGITGKPGFI